MTSLAYTIRALFYLLVGLGVVGAGGLAMAPPARGAESIPLPEDVKTFLQNHCADCHGATLQEAGLRYDGLREVRRSDAHLWTLIHEKLTAGEMPPKDAPQPATAEKERLLEWLETSQEAVSGSSLRRLNRREFSAALRDLTGLKVDYAASLPGDGMIDGFDTGADALNDAADSVAQAMQVTRRAVSGIRFLEPSPATVFSAKLRDAKDPQKVFDAWKEAGGSARGSSVNKQGLGLLLPPTWVGDRDKFSLKLPPPPDRSGLVRIELVVSAFRPHNDVPHSKLWVEVGNRDIDYPEITGTPEQPQRLVYEVQVDDLAIGSKGLEVALSNKVEVPYAVEGFNNDDRANQEKPVPGGTGLFRPAFDKKKTPLEEQPVPFVVLHEVEVHVDYVAAWPPAQWSEKAPALSDDEATAASLLKLWTDRAWRRPTTEEERSRFFTLYTQLRKQSLSFDESMRAAFQAVLMSAPFRYLASPAEGEPATSHYAIASRLSFFLTGGPPDAELLRLAGERKLREPVVLEEQVDRLLADPRSDGFVRPFVTQWLQLEQPITLAMSHLEKQDFRFGRHLKASMREETIAYVGRLLHENRPARELVHSDWTMMNDILAHHYGYQGIEGGDLRKVTLREDDPRGGGILGHAGIQSMLCWMGDNWVIYRGAWALRHVLDFPPPPPPLEVPELLPSDGANRGKTFRELLKQHQEDRNCAVCHKHIDPIGFAFQNFDLSGRWREVEYESYSRNELDGKIAWLGQGKSRPVDSTGQLPRGESFETFREFKELVATQYQDDLVRGLLKNLVIYAAGRRPDIRDMQTIRATMQQLKPQGYPAGELVKALICSPSFLDR